MKKEKLNADILVLGGGPGGLSAAAAAAREGAKVILVERMGFLGGGLASGLPLLAYLDYKKRQGNWWLCTRICR